VKAVKNETRAIFNKNKRIHFALCIHALDISFHSKVVLYKKPFTFSYINRLLMRKLFLQIVL